LLLLNFIENLKLYNFCIAIFYILKKLLCQAVIFIGVKKPIGLLAAAFVFALAECFSNYTQGFLFEDKRELYDKITDKNP